MPEIKKPYEFIICPICEGSGKGKGGLSCPHCGGLGLGRFFHGRFFYWGPNLGVAVIELDHLRQKFNQVINIISFGLGLTGMISLAVWVYMASQHADELGAFAFWRSQHSLILIFWLSAIADMFVFYRLSEESRKQRKITKITYQEKLSRKPIPNNWEELKRFNGKLKIDVASGFKPESMTVVERAYLLAKKLGHKYVEPAHLFFCALADKEVMGMMARLEIDGDKLVDCLKNQLAGLEKSSGHTKWTCAVKEILIDAYIQAYTLGQKKVTAKNFIVPLMDKDKAIKNILYDLEVDKEKVFNVLLWFIINDKLIENYRLYKHMARFKPGTNMDRAYTAVATPTLDHFAYDLTAAAKWGRLEFCVARDEEVAKIYENMESGQNGVILVGQSGVGKNTIVNGIAQAMVKEDVPRILHDKRLVELDASRLISGVTPAQAEGRMVAIMDEVVRAGNIVLFIDNIDNIIGISSGEEQSLDLSEVLASGLNRGNFYCLASSTEEHYIKYIEGRSLGNAFSKLSVKEPVGNQAIQIIESKIGFIEGKYRVYFSYNALEEVVNLSARYIHDKYLPDKAIKILETVAVHVAKKRGPESRVTKEDIAEVVSEITNIPVNKISENEKQNLLQLEDKIHERMINQEEAVKMVAASLRRARTQLREGKRPIASFLFAGPTGVGKTELAKSVADVYFGSEKYMVRLDMSEYQLKDSVTKMIGDPDGTLGYLTEAVRKSPFSLVLLDEFEKAHPDILNLFLQVMDDGRLTDGQGRTIDFTNSIIIATSNAGALYIQEEIFKSTPIEIIKQTLINEHLNKVMRPELINRFDGVIVFEPLSKQNIILITKLMLNSIGKMLVIKGIEFKYDEEGVRILADAGFDPKFGARPLRRLLQEKIEDEIANKILAGGLKRRDTVFVNSMALVEVIKAPRI